MLRNRSRGFQTFKRFLCSPLKRNCFTTSGCASVSGFRSRSAETFIDDNGFHINSVRMHDRKQARINETDAWICRILNLKFRITDKKVIPRICLSSLQSEYVSRALGPRSIFQSLRYQSHRTSNLNVSTFTIWLDQYPWKIFQIVISCFAVLGLPGRYIRQPEVGILFLRGCPFKL